MTSTSVPTLSDVLSALLPAIVLGLLDELRAMLRELVADFMTFYLGDVS